MVQWNRTSSSSEPEEPETAAFSTQTPSNWNAGNEQATQTTIRVANETATQTQTDAAAARAAPVVAAAETQTTSLPLVVESQASQTTAVALNCLETVRDLLPVILNNPEGS